MRDRERERARVRAYVRACVRVCCLSLHRLENRRCISLAPAQQQPTPSDTYAGQSESTRSHLRLPRTRAREIVAHAMARCHLGHQTAASEPGHICYSMHSERVMHAILAIKRQHQSRDKLARASFLVQRQQAGAAERSRTWGVCRELQHSCDASQVLHVEPM